MDIINISPESERQREIHPAGPCAGVLVDIIDLGMKVKDFQGNRSASQAVAFVFRTGKKSSEGFDLDLSQEFTASLNQKANLRKFIESWRGVPLTQEELGASFSLKAFAGKAALLSVVHKKSSDGTKTYANIGAVMPLPDGMKAPDGSGYKRAPFWEERKKEYAKDFAAYMRETMSRDADEEVGGAAVDETPF